MITLISVCLSIKTIYPEVALMYLAEIIPYTSIYDCGVMVVWLRFEETYRQRNRKITIQIKEKIREVKIYGLYLFIYLLLAYYFIAKDLHL